MKKVLLAGTALVGVALMSTAAQADLKLDLGGLFRAYGVYADNDETGTAAASDDLRTFELRRDTEVSFTGETTTDMGLTVGFHSEMKLGADTTTGNTDEVYAYFSGQWGRVNVGTEDGAAYLLQVAAPSADSNVDGMRNYIGAINTNVWENAAVTGAGPAVKLDYQHADFQRVDRLTYLTPKFNGFQAGISYTPAAIFTPTFGANTGATPNDAINSFDQLIEASARWDGEFQGFGISTGAGYSHASPQNKALSAAGSVGTDDLTTWNGGLNVAYSGFSLGGAYKWTNSGIGGAGLNGDVRTWDVGGAWDNGPYHVGLSYLNQNYGRDFQDSAGLTFAGAGAVAHDVSRWTLGGGYTFGPGMTFRGAFSMGRSDSNGALRAVDFRQATLGTDIQF